ncbi:MAG: hypothetical protein RLZZ297_355 [Chloroflexota bacterium]
MAQPLLTADLHLHTTISDGHATPEALVAYVVEHTTLDVIAVTDHDQISGALRAVAAARGTRLQVIVGEEISALDGHILAYFVHERIPPGLTTRATIAAIHTQGGIAVAAHPYDWMVRSCGRNGLLRRAAGTDPEWRFDAIETLNASLRPRTANTQAAAAAAVLGLPAIGGSDSHCLATIGYGVTTYVGTDAADLRAAVLQQSTVVSGRHWSWGDMAEAGVKLAAVTVRRGIGMSV